MGVVVVWGSLSEEEGALSCFAVPNTQTCLALSQLLRASLSHRPHPFVTWWPKWPKATPGASGCLGTTASVCPASCRFAPCFAGLPWTSHESIGYSNCSTSFITSFIHLHPHTPRGECRFQRERSSVTSDLWRRTPQKLKQREESHRRLSYSLQARSQLMKFHRLPCLIVVA